MMPLSRNIPGVVNAHACRGQAGVTLIELMISMAVSLFVVLAATALFVSTKSGYILQDDEANMQDTARYAIEVIGRAVRQASYENWDGSQPPVVASELLSPGVTGMDARSLKSRTQGVDSPLRSAVNGSDVLAVRFFGSGEGDNGDGTMLNCAGFGVAAPSPGATEEERGWSIFYVAKDSTGEPELYCKYRGNTNWTSQSIARGVESFQVLYGLDTDEDGLPNRLLNASAIEALDDALILQGVNAVERARDRSRKSHWRKIVIVKIALLVRGAHASRADGPADYHLFGRDYASASGDTGTRIRKNDLHGSVRGRVRRVFSSTIWLRGRSAGSST